MHNLGVFFTFIELLKFVLINMILMSAKLGAPGLLKVTVFCKKHYEVIVSTHNFTNKILSCDSNKNIDKVMWQKLAYCSISMTEVIITSNL